MSTEQQPIVCTLTTKQQASQSLEWRDLQGKALHSERIATGASMTFPATLKEQVEDLAAREASCCAFLEITATLVGDRVRVDITSANPDAMSVIELLSGTAGS